VSFGNTSGPVESFGLGLLAQKGSLFVTRPTLFNYASTPETLRAMAAELFDLVLRGSIQPDVRQTFALRDAADAHRAIESRSTTGATVLLP
jgi:NADPH2:quinone reductase